MIRIKSLDKVTIEEVLGFGFNGFMTDIIYQVSKEMVEGGLRFDVQRVQLDNTYVKEWRTSPESITSDNETIKLGLSFGAYDNNLLVGYLIVSEVKWNNSLWIENIRVADNQRGKGIGRALLMALEALGKERGNRLIGLEVMATNYPAVALYLKHQYVIDGMDLSHYPTRPQGQREVALFMKRYLNPLV